MAIKKKHRDTLSRLILYYRYYQRTGVISFFLKNFVKVVITLIAIVGLLLGLNAIFDIQKILEEFVFSLRPAFVYILFYISESVLGWIPPDIFIVWTKDKESPVLLITVLATISYLGGITAYWLGVSVQIFPRIHAYIERRFAGNFVQIQKWGGIIVVFAALFPLPFATISTIAGMVKYPFKKFLLYGLTRYIRFYVYAISIFAALNQIMN
jgi:membrane protein YqaA with SNARE-associated domain